MWPPVTAHQPLSSARASPTGLTAVSVERHLPVWANWIVQHRKAFWSCWQQFVFHILWSPKHVTNGQHFQTALPTVTQLNRWFCFLQTHSLICEMGMMTCFQKEEIKVSFTGLYIYICLSNAYSWNYWYRLTQNCQWWPCLRGDTLKTQWPLQVRYTDQKEKCRCRRPAAHQQWKSFFSQCDFAWVFKWLFQSSLSKQRDNRNHARILISTGKKNTYLSLILKIKEKIQGSSLLFSSLQDNQ